MGTSISEAAASSRKLPVPAEQPPFRSEGGAPLAKRDRAGAAQSQRTELIDGNLHIGGRGFFQKASRARRTAVIHRVVHRDAAFEGYELGILAADLKQRIHLRQNFASRARVGQNL